MSPRALRTVEPRTPLEAALIEGGLSVEDVAEALFDEWAEEIEQYSNARLKSESQRQLRETRRRYDGMITAMRKAESRMDPVLSALQDNVLYLKHNLNARAVASLKTEFQSIEQDVDRLIAEMRKAGLNIMMSMKSDGKPVSFVEDCAVELVDLAEYTAGSASPASRRATAGPPLA